MRLGHLICALLVASALIGCPDGTPPSDVWRPAFDARSLGWMMSTWAAPSGERYAVGGVPGSATGGVIMRSDGERWSRIEPAIALPQLDWVWGTSASDVFVVGDAGAIAHWDGTAWTRQDSGTSQKLWGVWGASSSDVWAVGGNAVTAGDAVILRYDGSRWRAVDVPTLSRSRVYAFFKVWGSAGDDVYVVGQRGAMVHWNGTALAEVSTGLATEDDLIAVWGSDAEHVVAVGGRGNGVVAVKRGDTWTGRSLSPAAGLNGVWLRNATTAHVVGLEGTLGTLDLATFELTEAPHDTRLGYHAISGDARGRLVAVGGNLLTGAAPYIGVASTRQLHDGE